GIPADGGAGQTRSIGPVMRGSNFGPSGGTAASPGSGSTKVAPRGLIGPNPGQIPSMLSPAPGVGLQQLVPGQVGLTVSARFGKGEGAIPGGLDWRVYSDQPDKTGRVRLVKEDKAASPTFMLPPGGYVVHVSFGLATATRHVRLRSETVREVFDLPAGGIRLEGRVGDVRIPSGQIAFDIFPGSQFDPGDKRPITAHVLTGDVVVLPAGTYHIVSNYGDANAVIRSDIRVQPGKLTDVTVTHHAAIITLKLVNERGGEALANTAWSVLTPGGDVIKESIGAFPRFILAEGDYRVIARNESKVFERAFKVKSGVDGEVEVQAQ
ncbi:MAG TPA: hypothetical protein VFQ90_12010, partial [Stellaceae bacterium]|nr:hypothetical protein [Stellaceae bacterium]